MIVTENGAVIGSLSGGCLEGAVFSACQEAMKSGVRTTLTFGYSPEDPFATGLTCGGEIDVLIEPYPEAPAPAWMAAGATKPAALIHRIDGRAPLTLAIHDKGTFSPSRARQAVTDLLGSQCPAASAGLHAAVIGGETRVISSQAGRIFVESRAGTPALYLFGANDFSAALAAAAKPLGYRVILCDARPVFATKAGFPDADEVAVRQPVEFLRDKAASGHLDTRSVICVLTHDPKFDVPLLAYALTQTSVAYIGVMGSRASQARLTASLRGRGIDGRQLGLLHGPIGLDVGAVTPAEVAISVLAEVIAKSRSTGKHTPTTLSLRQLDGPIHPDRSSADTSRASTWT